jgi:transcriptional regulator with XRE-family HTH domain
MTTTKLNILDEQSLERVRTYRAGTWIGLALKFRREELGLSQRDVERLVDAKTTAIGDRPAIGAAGLSRIESGHRYPALRTLEALAGPLRLEFRIGPDRTTVQRLDERTTE